MGDLLFLFFVLAAASMLFTAAEIVSVLLLRKWPFQIGLVAVVLEEHVACPAGLASASSGRTPHVKYRVTEGRRCFFTPGLKPFPSRSVMPGWIKGSISWNGGRLIAVGRYAVGALGLLLSCLVIFTVGGISSLGRGDADGLFVLVLVWFGAALLLTYGRASELGRFKEHLREVRALLERTPPER